ncbi:unnamed protein product, partial [Closterium sp. Naga37s-1]
GLSYNYLTYRVPPVSAAIKDLDVGFNFLSGSFPANTATSCGANSNCFQSAATCATKGTAQRTSGCNFCQASTGQGMLCYGRGVCTVNASAPFAAGTPNAVGAPTLPFTCVSKCLLLSHLKNRKNASVSFAAGTPNAVGTATLPFTCVSKCGVLRETGRGGGGS